MFKKATIKQLLTIFNYEKELCTPTVYEKVTEELKNRVGLNK